MALRYEATVPQRFDFTCGAASVATLLTFYWNDPHSEAMVLKTLERRYSREQTVKLTQDGLSFDDLIFMAGQLGYAAQGAMIPASELSRLAAPVIVHLDKGSLKHFVVLRMVGSGVFYISDPVVGQVALDSVEFERQYTGNALAVWGKSAGLSPFAVLAQPRDGVRVGDSVRRSINVPLPPFQPGF